MPFNIAEVKNLVPPLPDGERLQQQRAGVSLPLSTLEYQQKPKSSQITPRPAHQIGRVNLSGDPMYDVHRQLKDFWPRQKRQIAAITAEQYYNANKSQVLPLARIKRIMKLDDDVKNQMIGSDAPLFLARACEMFIEEITLKAWKHTEENRRRTLQKNDIQLAVAGNDHYDFLIDIVPRDEPAPLNGMPSGMISMAEPPTSSASSPQQQYMVTRTSEAGGAVPVTQFVMEGDGGVMIRTPDGHIMQATQIGQPVQLTAHQAAAAGITGVGGARGGGAREQ